MDTPDEIGIDILNAASNVFTTMLTFDPNCSQNNSESSSNESEGDSDDNNFHPEHFGLLDNPGVVRFGCLDYPEVASDYSDDEDLAASEHNTATNWIRVSCDELILDSNTAGDNLEDIHSDSKMISRSLNNIHNIYEKELLQCNVYHSSCQYCTVMCCVTANTDYKL